MPLYSLSIDKSVDNISKPFSMKPFHSHNIAVLLSETKWQKHWKPWKADNVLSKLRRKNTNDMNSVHKRNDSLQRENGPSG
jgi:hypothetical protein